MKEYIEKAALLENLNHAGILSRFVKFKIERFPAADVAEVRHGRWIFEPGKIPYCSECKEYSDDGDKGATFCPWCGARIDKEDEQ
jgi:hypothetical protein